MQNSIRITALTLWLPALACGGAFAEDLPEPEVECVSTLEEEPLFEPVSHSADDATIQMTMTGSCRGGFFANKSPSEPVHDPYTQRLLVPKQIYESLEVLDISDPYHPGFVTDIKLTQYGGEVENAAIHEGVVAVVVQDGTGETTLSNVLLMNVEGTLLAEPIQLETASGIAFTPHGRQLVVTQSGRPPDMDSYDAEFDPEGAVAVIFLGFPNWKQCRKGHVAACGIHPRVRIADFRAYNGREQELEDMGIRILMEEKGATAAQDLRPSALAVADDTRYAYVTLQLNNAIAVVDLWFARVVDLLPLGMRDNSLPGNGFDASDGDDAINIQNWPVFGMYMPDGVATSGRGRNTLLYTSNEGDLLDEDYLSEEVRINDIEPSDFPEDAMFQEDGNLGRLRISSISSDPDGDGVFDKLVMGGTRSFSIWTRDGQQLFDSGDDFEQVLAQAVPDCFNSPEDECKFDDRSPRKGPEPEYVTVGDIGGRKYLFIGFERMGGAIAYDVTDPREAKFQQYFNNRNFEIDPDTGLPLNPRDVCGDDKGVPAPPGCEIAGDLEVEGLMFIPAEDSPIGVPLLVLAHELSDSTSILRIDTVHN